MTHYANSYDIHSELQILQQWSETVRRHSRLKYMATKWH